ncbi:unnamed protein product, partial [Rotaria sp. Silwood2]
GALEILLQFLEQHLHHNKIGSIRIDDIMRMARLVLDTNSFAYEHKYYRQIRGGAMGSAFTQTLANIYMLNWEQQFIKDQQEHQEIYGRYIDDVFMTTNSTYEEMKARLDNAHRKDPNIRISYCIQSTIDFLDVTVNNDNGHLKTYIFYKSAAEPYILPYTSDHPKHVFRNIPYAALLRAARICSNVEEFETERIRTDLSLLLNEYPPSFISKHFDRFFELNQARAILERLDAQVYHELHQRLLHMPTRREKQNQETIENVNALPDVLRKKNTWDPNILYVKYYYESGPRLSIQHDFRQWWKQHFAYEGSNVEHVQLKFAVKTNCTLEDMFVHKKPSQQMLKRKPSNIMQEMAMT